MSAVPKPLREAAARLGDARAEQLAREAEFKESIRDIVPPPEETEEQRRERLLIEAERAARHADEKIDPARRYWTKN